jgi:UDP-galactopyranose mutase
VPYTRIVEHKHFAPWESHADTVLYKEYSREAERDDEPFYPVRLADDKAALCQYIKLAERDSGDGTRFIGRLGTYRYLDMHQAIGEALKVAKP